MNSRFSITVIYILLSISSLAASLADKDLRVISSSNQSLLVEYTPRYIDTSKISIENQQFIKIGLFNGDIPSGTEVGTAASPVRFIPVGVPSEYGNTIEIVESSFKEIQGRLAPRAKMVNKNGISALEYVISDKYYKQSSISDLVSFGDYG
ncbi:MAG: C25 family peptidase propeptide domain-containing protein, partial [Bacteroidota bacterium]|nr:C25 family peptidase propeptide domain-containing protein [Bacteroidota bacterium]